MNGEASTGLTGGESANGFCDARFDRGVVGDANRPAAAPYGGGAVALEADRLTPPAATGAAMTCAILGAWAVVMASRYGGAISSTLCTLGP